MGKNGLYHGGNLKAAERIFGVPSAGWLDLSTGINPNPYPIEGIPESAWAGLPDDGAFEALAATARQYYRFSSDAGLVAASGTQAILQALPYVVSTTKVAIVSPTYSEHAQSWSSVGCEVVEVATLAEGVEAADVVVSVEPNNPTGRISGKQPIKDAAKKLAVRGGLLIVDGAFSDVAPDADVADLAGTQGLLLLRSFGKFFGLAGLRLGFAAGEPKLIDGLGGRLGPWAVSGPAIVVGCRALADQSWRDATRTSLKASGERLVEMLKTQGLEIVGGTDLFQLVETQAAAKLFDHLGRQGILVRPFDGNRTWLRFGLPGTERDWLRLERAFRDVKL